MSSVGGTALTAARSRRAIRRLLATTPGRLRAAAGLLAVGAIVFGAVATRAVGARQDAVHDVATTEPLLDSAVDISASLSDAHAIAAASFLRGGPESPQSRRLYTRQLERAGARVAELAREIGTSSGSGPAVRLITQKLPVYAGLMGNARANNRQGFPVGSAYLRAASNTMSDDMLRSARGLYEIEARNLTSRYRAGVSRWTMLVVVLAGAALLALLAGTQVYIAAATRRILNLRLALATAIALGAAIWIVVAFAQQQNALAQAQHRGSDPFELLTVTRILASRAQAKESIALAARGGGQGAVDRGFQAVARPIGTARPGPARGSGGLLDQAAAITGGSTASIDAIYDAYLSYMAAHARVVEQERRGIFDEAVALAVGSDAGEITTKDAAVALNAALDREIGSAQSAFDDAILRAGSALDGLAIGVPVLIALCALLALFGVRERLEEYR